MANLIQIDTTGCNSDYTVSLPNPTIVGKYITVKDKGTNPSFFASNAIIIVSGQPFFGGSTAEYIRSSRGALSFITTTSTWRLLNTVPYTTLGQATLANISTTHLLVYGSISSFGQITTNGIRVPSIDAQVAPTINASPVMNTSNIVSTVVGLGSTGFLSSVSAMNESFTSTTQNLGGYGYISTPQIQSTIQGLGNAGYISTSWVTSTVEGLGKTYLSTPALTSTAQGLGTFGYISSSWLTSTMEGLGSIDYISTAQLTSTVSNMLLINTSNYLSTFQKIGSNYISSSFLTNTIQNLGLSYVSAASFNSSISGTAKGYETNLTSSVSGFASLGYISTYSLFSTTEGVEKINQSNTATTLSSLGDTYIATTSIQSTVAGLGSLPFTYISTASLVSTMSGLTKSNVADLTSSVINMGQYYISRAGLVSTTLGLTSNSASNITSTINNLGCNTNAYISTPSLQSTINGLALPPFNYVSSASLTSTTTGMSNAVTTMNSTLIGLGSVGYVSAASLTSTIQALGSLPYRYVSTASLVSTVQGLGTSGYISRENLNTTTNTLTSLNHMPPITSTLNGLGNVYISTAVIDVYQVTTVNAYLAGAAAITNALVQTANVTTSTVAGSSSNYTNGQTGTFASPRGVVLDSAGNMYVSDYLNCRIRRITPSGNVSTYAGSGAAGSADGNGTSATFYYPYQLAIDSLDNIYVADAGSHKIRKIDILRNVTTIAGSGSQIELDGQGTSAGFDSPSGIAIDSAGFLYVAGSGHMIRLITPTGYVTTYAGTGWPSGTDGRWNVATFTYPRGLAFGSNVLYVADAGNNKIRSITETRTVSTYAPSASTSNTGVYQYPAGVVFNFYSDNLYLTDRTTHVIWSIKDNGYGSVTILPLIGSLGLPGYVDGEATSARFNQPCGIALDAAGNIYVADHVNQRIRKIDAYGVSTYAGSGSATSTDGLWYNAGFNYPYGIAVDSSGAVYVAEYLGHKIKKVVNTSSVFKPYTRVLSVAVDSAFNVYASYDGQPGSTYVYAKFNSSGTLQYSSTSGGFSSPLGIAVDSSGAMYIADTGNNAIKKISTDGTTVTTHIDAISQPKGLAFSGDTLYVAALTQVGKIIPASGASTTSLTGLNAWGVALDSAGNIWVANTAFNQVIKYNSSGTVLNRYGDPAGSAGYADYSLETLVRFDFPIGVVVAQSGTVYIADTNNNVIRQITQYGGSGATQTFAGIQGPGGYINGSYLSAKFSGPYALTVDASENVYVADTGNHVIRKLSGGQVTTYAGANPYNNPSIANSFPVTLAPYGVAVTGASGAGQYYFGANVGSIGNTAGIFWIRSRYEDTPESVANRTNFYLYKVFTLPAYDTYIFNAAADDDGGLFINGVAMSSFGNSVTGATYIGGPGPINIVLRTQNRAAQGAIIMGIYRTGTNSYIGGTDGTWMDNELAVPQFTAVTPPSAGYTNGSLASAQFNFPQAITIDSSGNLYVADTANNAIRKITSSAVTTVAGLGPGSIGSADGPTSSATFSGPRGIALDPSNNIYVMDAGNNSVRFINVSTNQVSTYLTGYTNSFHIAYGNGGRLYVARSEIGTVTIYSSTTPISFQVIASGFTNAMSLCIDSSGNIYVADQGTNQIKKIDTSSNVTVFAGTSSGYQEGARLSARFSTNLIGICMIGGVIYVADNGNGAIRTIYNEVVSTYATGLSPGYIAVDSSGVVYVANAAANIIKLSRDVTTFVGSGNAAYADGSGTSASFNKIYEISIDPSNNLYVADSENRRVRKVTAGGMVTTLAGSGGAGFMNGPSTTAQLNPLGVYVDSTGIVYVTDHLTNTIRLIYPDGYVTSIAGTGLAGYTGDGGLATNATFNNPRGIVGDYRGHLYVVDVNNFALRKITFNRTVATFAGEGTAGATNGANLSATFNSPRGIVVDGSNVYVSDFNAHDIRKISGGQVTTYAGQANSAGSADGTSASFSSPVGLATDPAGNVYVADQANFKIRKITPYSYTNTIFYANTTDIYKLPLTTMTPASFVTGQTNLNGMTCDRTYVYATCGTMVKSFHMTTGAVTIIAGTSTPGSANGTTPASVGFDNLQSIAIDPSFSNLYVCDIGNAKIRKIQLSPLSVTTKATLTNCVGIAIDSFGTYAYVTTSADKLYKVSLQQDVVSFLADVAGYPQYITLDPTNTYAYITCIATGVNLIRQVHLKTYTVTTIAGSGTPASIDGAGTLASFNQPYGIVFNPSDAYLYSTDRGSGLLRKIATQVFLSSMIGLNQSRIVPTIFPNSSITNPQTYQFIHNSNGTIRTTPNLYLQGNTITTPLDIRATGYIVTAKTFTAKSGTAGNGGYFIGDGTGVTVTSDIRTKENIQPIRNALSIVRQLQAVEYTKIDDPSRRWLGYIAQDVENVLPHIVRTDHSPEQWKSIQYTYLPGLIIEALKELKAKIDKIECLECLSTETV